MVSSLSPSLPSEFALRQEEVQSPAAAKPNEAKPDPKRSAASSAEQTDVSEIINGIQPALPTESQPVGLELQTSSNSGETAGLNEQAAVPREETPAPTEAPVQTQAQPESTPPEKTTEQKVSPGDLVALDKITIPPTLIKRVDPKYPLQGFNMGVSGTVTVNALISETGDVLRTEIIKGIKGGYGFEKSAETAVRQWKFRPAEKDGIPVRVWKPIDITFKLSQTPNQ
jgi:protein TonB